MLNPVKISLSEREARHLGRQVVKDSKDVRVKFGMTNGRRCLHIRSTTEPRESRTIYSSAGWDEHPANYSARAAKTEAREAAEAALKNITVTNV